jgi:putative endonuclease
MYYVYVLKSVLSGKLYKGQTSNLDDRLHRYFSGQSITTKSLLPLELVFAQTCQTRSEATDCWLGLPPLADNRGFDSHWSHIFEILAK